MSEETLVPAQIINDLIETIMEKVDKLRKDILYEKQDAEEFSYNAVAMYGALILTLERHIHLMKKNGYTTESLGKLEQTIRDSFVLVEESDLIPEVGPALKN